MKIEFIKYCLLSSLADPTPEGKSIVELAAKARTICYAENCQGWKIY